MYAKWKPQVKISSPWVAIWREIDAMFGKDPEIKVTFDEDKPEVKLHVSNPEKADALSRILQNGKIFGNVVLNITVIPENKEQADIPRSVYSKAFAGNPVFRGVTTVNGAFTNPVTYVVFAKEVVQYFNDNLADINGNENTLYEDIAADILAPVRGVFYCTDATEANEEVCDGNCPEDREKRFN